MDAGTKQNVILGFAALAGGVSATMLGSGASAMLADNPTNRPRRGAIMAIIGGIAGLGACALMLLFMWPAGEALVTRLRDVVIPLYLPVLIGSQGFVFWHHRMIGRLNAEHKSAIESARADVQSELHKRIHELESSLAEEQRSGKALADRVDGFAQTTGLDSDLVKAAGAIEAERERVSALAKENEAQRAEFAESIRTKSAEYYRDLNGVMNTAAREKHELTQEHEDTVRVLKEQYRAETCRFQREAKERYDQELVAMRDEYEAELAKAHAGKATSG